MRARTRLATAGLLLGPVAALHYRSEAATRQPSDDYDPIYTPFYEDYTPRGDAQNPRMLVMRGCSGSSAMMVYARTLLRLHGIPVPPAYGKNQCADNDDAVRWEQECTNGDTCPPEHWAAELLKWKKNCFYDEAGQDIGRATELANQKIHSKYNKTLFFQGMLDEISDDNMWTSLKPSFIRMKMLAVLSSRANVLDQIVCQVRDCFNSNYGYPVDSNSGDESNLCFARRDDTVVRISDLWSVRNRGDYKAMMNVTMLKDHIGREIKLLDDTREHLKGSLSFLEVAAEDLLEFETGTDGSFDRGVKAWSDVMSAFGVKPDSTIITDFLGHFVNTYETEKPHKDSIYNWQDVKNELDGTSYAKYWRD